MRDRQKDRQIERRPQREEKKTKEKVRLFDIEKEKDRGGEREREIGGGKERERENKEGEIICVRDGEREIKFLHIISKFVVFCLAHKHTQWTFLDTPSPPHPSFASLRLQGVE